MVALRRISYLDGVCRQWPHAQVVLVEEEEVLVPQPDHARVLGLDGAGEGGQDAGPSLSIHYFYFHCYFWHIFIMGCPLGVCSAKDGTRIWMYIECSAKDKTRE